MFGKKLLVVSLLAAACGSAFAQQPGWAGPYIGLQVAKSWSEQTFTYTLAPSDNKVGMDGNGVIGGVTAGYNWQRGNLVYGVEGDLSTGNTSENRRTDSTPPCYVDGCKSKVGSSASVRARVGYVINSFMPYLTIGGAYANIKGSADLGACGYVGSCSYNSDKWGLAYGVGVEWRYSANWSAKAEYIYSELDKPGFTNSGVRTNTPEFSVFRLGVNYRF